MRHTLALKPANPDDAVALVAMREAAASWMLANGIDQWRPGQIGVKWYRGLIDAGTVWVLRAGDGGHLRGSVTVVWEDSRIWGPDQDPAGYIHGLMIDRREAGRGLGAAVLAWAEDHIRSADRPLARLDCVTTNLRLRSYYETAGYGYVGESDYGDPRWPPGALYQKELSPDRR